MKAIDRKRYTVLTPEGVPLTFDVASAGDRMAAFALDFLVVAGATLLVGLLATLSSLSARREVALAVAYFVLFLFRVAYFPIFELRWLGATFGKRRLNLRVLARDGGPLTAEMIIARNLTRELELFIPLTVLIAPGALFPQEKGWAVVVGMVWLLVFALLPLFGRLRLRCGDLLAGTMVIVEPRARLLPDLSQESRSAPSLPEPPASRYVFTPRQLDLYGIRELQVLEDVFRRREEGQADDVLLADICRRIRRKIGWPRSEWDGDIEGFLRAFYRAQRAHLERKLLFGQRKERKSDERLG